MRKRALPHDAFVALDTIVESGRRDISRNELLLRLHQRGLTGHDVGGAIRAFHRRGWVELDGSTLVITKAAFEIGRAGGPKPAKQSHRCRRPRVPDLFA